MFQRDPLLAHYAVEIDPTVVRFAREHFNLDAASSNIFVEDARSFLSRTTRKYDVVVHDTFTGGATPEHLLSKEVVTRIQQVLQPNGLLVLNFVGGTTGDKAEASKAVARTLRAVFRNVRAFTDSSKADIANIIFFASNAGLGFEAVTEREFNSRELRRARQAILSNEVFPKEAGEPVITDELNPLARMELPITDEHAAAMKKLLPMEVWLH